MKKILIILTLFLTFNSFAQERGSNHERIKALKIAFISEHLQLTEIEAQQFWPIYNTYEEENQKLRKQGLGRFKDVDFESISEDNAKTQLQNMLNNENKKHNLRQQFLKDLMKVLPAKKIILLKAAEDNFKRKMMERLRGRKDGFIKNKP